MKNNYKSYIHLADGKDVGISYELTDDKLLYIVIGSNTYGMCCFDLFIVLNILKNLIYIPEKHLQILEERI